MSAAPRKLFSFTDFTLRQPTVQPPGDRIDAQFDEHAHAISKLQAEISDFQVKLQALQTQAPKSPAPKGSDGSPNSPALFSVNSAENWAQVSWHWAEYMSGPVPADSIADMGIAGDHWSSAWWAREARDDANRAEDAADVAEDFNKWYLGPFPAPPTLDNNGQPLKTGALYFDTSLNQMRVWNGTAWVAGPTTASVAAIDVLSNPSGDVSSTNVQLAINELAAEKATKAELANALAHVAVSDGPPASPVVGSLWYDSNNGRLFVYVDSFWVQVKGS